ncbi:MAG: PadR family transcriptional regulator [Gemmatimonadetes bacterium]|nr:PadR family transcriptional regulator [Gemmatimonadota bacterium]MBP9106247.1 PadR family transcriptional regulator [Gemmatimonadaceae bacterium]MBK6457295.1 PadR family transcriptional regulator [Gemmatimonadota bacterium]MBK6842507.1 PadR family transcriptional regulator [Gemmatimonadota bacterium]MBK7830918.1 PadR family transcriptional regulator [Gemmatimonadota bacterium]
MQTETLELLRGTLDLLILRALKVEPTHGYGVLKWIERATGDQIKIEEGSLYPALYRLQKRGWISSEWGLSENNRRARFYALTPQGRTQLDTEVDDFVRFASVVFRALDLKLTPA